MAVEHSHIEINGKKYDARTGRPLSDNLKPVQKPSEPHHAGAHRNLTASPHHKAVHESVQRSQTLMRHAVKKPASQEVKITESRRFSDVTAPSIPSQKSISYYHQIDREREARAKDIKQSKLVRKFNDFGAGAQSLDLSSRIMHHDKPVLTRVAPLAVQPVPAHAHPAPGHHRRTENILEKGLQNATSHQQPAPAKAKRHKPRGKRMRLATVGAGSMAVLLLGGFFAYQNIPQVSMRYAAARAGVNAQLPGYQPGGFSLNNHIQYNPGQITLSFGSNTDERNFTITQRASTWNSETLKENFVATKDDQVQTYEDKGRTIYLYGESNATWVNGGIWYEINGNSQLTSEQLVRIAGSM